MIATQSAENAMKGCPKKISTKVPEEGVHLVKKGVETYTLFVNFVRKRYREPLNHCPVKAK
jgi:hypothetical protein